MLPGSKKSPKWRYRAERTDTWGMDGDGYFIAGLTLVPIHEPPGGGWLDDPIGHDLSEGGTDCDIQLPKGGLVEGRIYNLVFDEHRDWETGIVEDYTCYIVEEG